MRPLASFCLLLCVPWLRAAAVPAATPDYTREAVVIQHYDTVIRMAADGTGDRNDHVVLRVQTEGAVRQFGVLAITYAGATAHGTVEHVQVHKPDGTVIATPASDSIETTPAVTREAPLYSDVKEVQLPVRSLAAGDVLEYDLHTVMTHAEAPGQFWGAERLRVPGVVLSRTFSLRVPLATYVQVWSPNYKPTVQQDAASKTYLWTTEQLKPTPAANPDAPADAPPADKDPDEDSLGRKLPSLAWTTFHSWAEVGTWYRGLALTRAQPDAALRARAETLTTNAKTPEEQVHALYTFVARNTRYVGIDLGIGRFQPHPAADVLSNQYGDCKDKDTLLEALLRAKGFTVAPALIGAGITPVPDVPSPAVFNHVITTVTLPTGQVWMDSTAELGPYRWLSPQLRDQEALIIPADAPAHLEKTPLLPPYTFTASFTADGTLSDAGIMKSHMLATYCDDAEIFIRTLARDVAPAEWDKASQYFSSLAGFGGTTSNTRFPDASNDTVPAAIAYDYTRKDYADWPSLRIVPLFPTLVLENNLGETKAPEHDLDLGVPRTATALSRIALPAGWHTDLPDAVHAKSPYATLDKTYRFEAGTITVERTLKVLQPKVPKADWKQYQAFCKAAGFDGEPWIQLIRPAAAIPPTAIETPNATTGNKTVVHLSPATPEIPPAPADASVDTLRETAGQQIGAGQYGAARKTLDRLKAKAPDAPKLDLMYGTVALLNRDFDDAVTSYRRETERQPDLSDAWAGLAEAQFNRGDKTEARQTLQAFFDRHPDDARIGQRLAQRQMAAEDYTGAVKTLQALSTAQPDDRRIRLQLGNALLAAGQREEAAAVAQSVLDGTDDPGLQNDAGYVLAQTGQHLPQAETASRASVDRLEAKSRTIHPDEANSRAFQESNLLIAAWDTLGWVLQQEGKLAEARPYLQASWRNALHPEVGDHLGQVEEQAGDTAAALQQYQLALASTEGGMSPAVRTHLKDRIAALQAKSAAPASPGSLTQTLQASRTYTVPRHGNASGWGTFRLQLTATGVQAVQQSSGDPKLAVEAADLTSMHFPQLVPVASQAWLLRSGVLSCPSTGPTCELVLVPNSGLFTEQQ